MPENIFLFENGQQHGPYTSQQLSEWIQAQRVNPSSLAWFEGLPGWKPLNEACPELFQQAPHMAPTVPHWQQQQAQAAAPQPQQPQTPAQPAYGAQQPYAPQPAPAYGQPQQPAPQQWQQPAPYTPPKTVFEVITKNFFRLPKITLENEEVVLESGALHYMLGNIEIESKLPSMGGAFKSLLSGENIVRPRYRGTGEIYLEPTFGEVNIMDIRNEEWILDRGAFMAADRTIEVGMFTNKAFSGFFGGEGFFQTSIKGSGKFFYLSPGPVERIDLNGAQTLVVDGSFAVARTASLEYTVERATKKLFGSMTSGEGLVSKFRGTGTVWIAPVPNEYMAMMSSFGSIQAAIAKIQTK
ncbi:MAG: AIM24 family protein [Acidobacteria bacterium]|nr:AIM24 family protein [Acidobacteriota bacterium]